jgi:succinyl-CoA synthetase beta subunit
MNVLERIAFNWGLKYQIMNEERGNIGLMCNGWALNLASSDVIQLKGGTAASFLQLVGDSSIDDFEEALNLL